MQSLLDMKTYNPDSLFADHVDIELEQLDDNCRDDEGCLDVEDFDYYAVQIERDAEELADVLSVFAEEALRFS